MTTHEWLMVANSVAALGGVALVAIGLRDRRRTAAQLEADAPDGSAASRARLDALSIPSESGPPPWDRVATLQHAHDPAARQAFEFAKPARAEAARRQADALEFAETRERELRRSLADDLRGGLRREAVGAALLFGTAVIYVLDGLS